MRSTTIEDVQDHISEEAVRDSATNLAPPSSILAVVRSGILARTAPIAVTSVRVAFNQDIKSIEPDPAKADVWFLYWMLKAYEPVILSDGVKKGATVHSIRSGFLESLEIPLPLLDEQRRIANGVGVQMAAVERARAAGEAQLEVAKVLSVARLRALFDNPQSILWPRSPLGEVADLLPSRSIASDGDTRVQAITTACLTEMGFSTTGIKAARMWRRDVPECTVSPDEVLVARSNTPELVGRASRFEGEPAGVVASDLTIRIRARGELSPGFLSGYLSFLYLSGYWKERPGERAAP